MSDDPQTEAEALEARLVVLRALAAEDPGDATTHFLLGRELLGHGRAAEAIPAFEAAIRADADYAAAYRQLGNAQEAAGRTGEAAATWQRGIEVAARTNDLQAGKEMNAFLRRLTRERPPP